MILVSELVSEGCRIKGCCSSLGIPRSSYYRRMMPEKYGPRKPRPAPANRISEDERNQIRVQLHEPRFVDRTPREIVPTLMDEGIYIASIRTFYRILEGDGELQERRLQASHPKQQAPILEATAPNQVWSWDITRIKGPWKGKFYYLYVMIDIYSRYIVGWMLAERENARKAQHFIRETASRHLGENVSVTIHNDRGSPMKAGSTMELVERLGLKHSFSRPRTSDDNPYSESQFKTLKYSHGFPSFFESIGEGEAFLDEWFTWYNAEHRHCGLNLHTPESVYRGKVMDVVRRRQDLMDLAYSLNPERFAGGKSVVKANPGVVGINLHLKVEKLESGADQKISNSGNAS